MSKKCDVCNEDGYVECEILTKGDSVDRVYHLCPEHWISVYRKSLEDFVEQNEYKVNSYIKMSADKLIVDARHNEKVNEYINDDGELNIDDLDPKEIRRLRPYEPESNESDYE